MPSSLKCWDARYMSRNVAGPDLERTRVVSQGNVVRQPAPYRDVLHVVFGRDDAGLGVRHLAFDRQVVGEVERKPPAAAEVMVEVQGVSEKVYAPETTDFERARCLRDRARRDRTE
jgi:hypothetical protein